MRLHFLIAILLLAITPSYAQNDPVPDYLTKQYFPDSVKSVSVVTTDGRKLSFGAMVESYKGKKIVIDIWASWCRDCFVGLPKLEELKTFTGEKDVVYLMLSVDKDEQKWLGAIEKFSIRGEHYRVEGAWKTPLSNYIALDWVPRYLVLDEKGQIIMPKAILADDPSLKNALVK